MSGNKVIQAAYEQAAKGTIELYPPKPHANSILIADVIEIITRIERTLDANLLEISLSISSILYKLDHICTAVGVVKVDWTTRTIKRLRWVAMHCRF